ncbi:MAG: hypothetical protein CO189_04635 [candidate division Zixibacteria bacterium CG_4_9_14_3_um_filter_46_8]|nr:MAG: hypothetical protein CO189_04635 [candidate division Zixibacteria bacterium CG_4_9_14_3_um_filter_46_8]
MFLLAGLLTLSFLSALALTPVAILTARRFRYLDNPGARKVHMTPTPLLGGGAVLISFGLAFALGLNNGVPGETGIIIGYIAGALLIFAVGLIDDGIGMTPGSKFIGQALTAVIFLVFGRAGGIMMNTPIDFSIAMLWMITLMNALNFLDNMDGLCSGISFCAALGYTILGILANETLIVIMGISLMGALLGFMFFNLNPARIFLGDAGSMFLGYTLGAMGIMFAISHPTPQDLLIPLLIMSYPFFDISFVTFTRFREGRSVAQPGKDHTSHRLVNLGIRSSKAVWGIFIICLVLAILSNLLFLSPYSNWKLIVAAIIALLLLVLGIHLSRRFANIKEKLLLVAIDIIGINAAFIIYYLLRFQSGLFATSPNIPMEDFVPAVIWIVFYWLFLFGILGQYEFLWDRFYRVELVRLIKSVAAGIGISILLSFDFSTSGLNLILHLSIYGILVILIIGMLRGCVLYALGSYYARGPGKRRTILIGSGDSMQWFDSLCAEKPEWAIKVVGRVSFEPSDTETLGRIDELAHLIKNHRVSDVIILEPGKDTDALENIVDVGNSIDVQFRIFPQLKNYIRGMKVETLYRTAMLKIYPERMRTWEWGLKRLTDLLGSIIMLILGLPLLLISAILIKINIGGSILVYHKYMGLGQKIFNIPVFRVSRDDYREEGSCALKTPPQSAWGKFLRATGVERFPMLFAVLRGKMAIIGPDPDPIEIAINLAASNPLYARRWEVKPGLINMARVAGVSSAGRETSSQKLELDLKYLENMSTLTDTKIFLSGMMRFWTKILSLRNQQ